MRFSGPSEGERRVESLTAPDLLQEETGIRGVDDKQTDSVDPA